MSPNVLNPLPTSKKRRPRQRYTAPITSSPGLLMLRQSLPLDEVIQPHPKNGGINRSAMPARDSATSKP